MGLDLHALAPGGTGGASEDLRTRGLWVLTTLPPFGFVAPVGFLYAGHRAGMRSLYAAAVLWGSLAYVGLAINIPAVEDSDLDGFSSVLMMIAWIGALVHALVIRGTWVRRVRERATSPMAAARRRLEERERAHRLAGADPRLARELGVGRPDVTGAEAMGVIDLNHVPARVLAQLPGLDGDLAQRIVEVREEIDGFSSAEDLGHVLGLDADVVDRLGERTVYLPR